MSEAEKEKMRSNGFLSSEKGARKVQATLGAVIQRVGTDRLGPRDAWV